MKTTFKVIDGNLHEYDSNGKVIHSKDSNGYEWWSEFDINGKLIHFKNSDGFENWSDYDSNGKEIHCKNSNGYEWWSEYDSNGKLIHYKNSNGCEIWYDSNGKKITKKQFDKLNSSCVGKVVEIAGRKYHLTLI